LLKIDQELKIKARMYGLRDRVGLIDILNY